MYLDFVKVVRLYDENYHYKGRYVCIWWEEYYCNLTLQDVMKKKRCTYVPSTQMTECSSTAPVCTVYAMQALALLTILYLSIADDDLIWFHVLRMSVYDRYSFGISRYIGIGRYIGFTDKGNVLSVSLLVSADTDFHIGS